MSNAIVWVRDVTPCGGMACELEVRARVVALATVAASGVVGRAQRVQRVAVARRPPPVQERLQLRR